MNEAARSKRLLTIFVVLVGLYCGWILSLPLFPSQDGPMHLYFANIIAKLLSGHSTIYNTYYSLRHLPPPYSLHYVLLLLVAYVCSLVVADKFVTCLVLA